MPAHLQPAWPGPGGRCPRCHLGLGLGLQRFVLSPLLQAGVLGSAGTSVRFGVLPADEKPRRSIPSGSELALELGCPWPRKAAPGPRTACTALSGWTVILFGTERPISSLLLAEAWGTHPGRLAVGAGVFFGWRRRPKSSCSLPIPGLLARSPHVMWFLKTTFFRAGKGGRGREGGLFSREGTEQAALRSSAASLCAVESREGFIPLHGASRTRFPSAAQEGCAPTAPWAGGHERGGAMQPGRTAEAAAGRAWGSSGTPAGTRAGLVSSSSSSSRHPAGARLLPAGRRSAAPGWDLCYPTELLALDGGTRLQTGATHRGGFPNGFCSPVPARQRGENHL